MSRFRILLLGLLAVAAVVVVTASAASADTCSGGSQLVFCTGGATALVGETVLGTSGLSLLAGTLSGVEAKFHCASDDFKATLEALGAFKGLILFLNCTEEKPAGCQLSTEQQKEIDATFTGQARTQTLSLFTGNKGGVAEEFTSLVVQGTNCVSDGVFAVTGKQLVEMPKGATAVEVQELVAKKSLSFLKLGGNTASFSSTAKAHLGGANLGSAWFLSKTGV